MQLCAALSNTFSLAKKHRHTRAKVAGLVSGKLTCSDIMEAPPTVGSTPACLTSLTFTPRPAGVSCLLLRSFRPSSPISDVRCCRQSACPCEAEMCSRLLPSSSRMSSRLSAAR